MIRGMSDRGTGEKKRLKIRQTSFTKGWQDRGTRAVIMPQYIIEEKVRGCWIGMEKWG